MRQILMALLVCICAVSCTKKDKNVLTIKTNMGDIKVRLYDETPLHRDNFLKLAKEGFYDGILFHRVINHFVIQAGDPDSKGAPAGMMLGANDNHYTIDAEIRPGLFHKKGVIAAAREGDNINPKRESSGSHFYIAQGKVYTAEELDSLVVKINESRHKALFERLKNEREAEIQKYELVNDFENLEKINKELSEKTRELFKDEELVLTDEQKKAYTTVGGIPRLDGAYTVFGEVVEGLDVLDKIEAVQTDQADRPLEDVIILSIK